MLTFAKALLFIHIVLLSALCGAATIFIVVMVVGSLTGASNINGGLAMGAAGMTPIGGLIGAAIGAWLGWRAVTRMQRKTVLAAGFGVAALTVLCAGAWLAVRELTDGNPYRQGEEPVVHLEWRLPETVPHDRVQPLYRYTFRSSYMDWTLSSQWDDPFVRDQDGHTILRFRTRIRWRVDGRIFQLWTFPNHDDRITVGLNLPRSPKPADSWSPWVPVDGAEGHAFRTRVAPPP